MYKDCFEYQANIVYSNLSQEREKTIGPALPSGTIRFEAESLQSWECMVSSCMVADELYKLWMQDLQHWEGSGV